MTARLLSLDEALAPVLAALRPVAPERLPLVAAIGLILAEDILAPAAVPVAAVALRPGLAVASLDLVGASAQSPVDLPGRPPLLAAGDTLPPGCDALLDPADLLTERGAARAIAEPEPGGGVRLAGHDLAPGERIAAAGAVLTPEMLLAAAIAGHAGVAVRRPAVRLDWPEGPERAWLDARLRGLGIEPSPNDRPFDLALSPIADETPRLALGAGGAASVGIAGDVVDAQFPRRFDGLVAAWCVLLLPILARLAGTGIVSRPCPLARKAASAIGMTEVVLLRLDGGRAQPLAPGEPTLGAIAAAEAFALLPAGSEGLPAGAAVAAVLLDRPFGAKEAPP